MSNILLLDVEGTRPNNAFLHLSSWHKSQKDKVYLNNCPVKPDKVYIATIFPKSKKIIDHLRKVYPDAEIGGTGYDIEKKLPPHIENTIPDYSLYGIDYGMGFTSRGCVRNCPFCWVRRKEGLLHQAAEIKDLLNPLSNRIWLMDNNFTADPYCVEKCKEFEQRGLKVTFDGIDVRLMTDEKAIALSKVKTDKQMHIAWDLMKDEKEVIEGIKITLKHIKTWRIKCYILCGFDTTFEEDTYRVRKINELGIDPYIMVYNDKYDYRLHHFERWVNGYFYKSCKWEEYKPYKNGQQIEGQTMII